MPPKVTRAGDRGLLAEFGAGVAAAELHARAAALRARPNVTACIAGQQSLYVIFDGEPSIDFDDVPLSAFTPRNHAIDVDFRGADLDEFLAHAGLTRDAFLEMVPSLRLTARYLGFRAGFAYLEGWPEGWRMPRRTRSRNVVPRGTFAIAGAMAGFYPIDSPGGWNILGRTNAALWNPEAEPPNRFAPGDVIEIRPASISQFEPQPASRFSADGEVIAEVIAPGQLTTIVGARDWKRAGYGVSPGGPFDAFAAALANRAAGNGDDAPVLECVLVAPRLKFSTLRRAAFCDGSGNVQTFTLGAGEELNLGCFHGGLRGYLAIDGGIDEMRSRYAEAPTVVRAAMSLRKATVPHHTTRRYADDRSGRNTIRIIPGPHEAPPLPEEWEVTAELNRIGIRLRRRDGGGSDGERPALRELPSCGMQFGTLQWHPDGTVVAMGPDHPVTGGYLQPATVISEDLWKLAQLAPGEQVTLLSKA
jgi:KipI family sensor histidine kinase inhibitor